LDLVSLRLLCPDGKGRLVLLPGLPSPKNIKGQILINEKSHIKTKLLNKNHLKIFIKYCRLYKMNKWPNHFVSGKQFQKSQITTPAAAVNA